MDSLEKEKDIIMSSMAKKGPGSLSCVPPYVWCCNNKNWSGGALVFTAVSGSNGFVEGRLAFGRPCVSKPNGSGKKQRRRKKRKAKSSTVIWGPCVRSSGAWGVMGGGDCSLRALQRN